MQSQNMQACEWVENSQGVVGLIKAIWWHEWAGAWQMSVIVPGEQFVQLWWCEAAKPVAIADKPEPFVRVILLDDKGDWYIGYILQVTSQEIFVQVQGYPEPMWISRHYAEMAA